MADIHEVHVKRKEEYGDPRGADVAAEAKRVLGIDTNVQTTSVYRLEGPTSSELAFVARKALIHPVIEKSIDPLASAKVVSEAVGDGEEAVYIGTKNPKRVVEVSYKPEVTDPVSASIQKVGADLGVNVEGAKVSTVYEFEGISQRQADLISEKVLRNKTVQDVVAEPPDAIVVRAERGILTFLPTMESTDDELMKINKEQGTNMALPKLQAIRKESKRLGRNFTDGEFHFVDGAWSEHCVHESFEAEITKDGIKKPSFFSRIKESSRRHFKDKVATAFEDNSGGMHFYDEQVVLVKWETHNSPSALEPKGGAATGSGGVFRDIMGTGQGAKVIMSTDVFMTGPTDMDPSLVPDGCIPPDIMLRGVVAGVRDYGNPTGYPTMNGSVYTHEDFRAKPTILVGAYGMTPEKYAKKGEPQVGDRVVAIGGRTGRDGIHGASFSSVGMSAETVVVNSASVQIGNPIEEKKVGDFILDARDSDFIRAITDCGAAGFASAVGEMGDKTGVNIDLSKAPTKYQGLSPMELWMSESQERMVVAVAPENLEAFQKLAERHGVEATDLGFFDGSNKLQVFYEDEQVVNLDYDFIKNGRPRKTLEAKFERQVFEEKEIPEPATEQEWIDLCKKILSHDNVCSKLPITEQYDSTVQGNSVMGPFAGVNFDGPTDAAIVKPIAGKPYGMIVSHGTNPLLNRIDPRRGTIWAATEAISNLVAAGGDYRDAVLCGNYITPVLDEHFTGLVDMMVDAMTEFQDALEIPVVSGKDSVSSTYNFKNGEKLHIPPVINVATLGKMPDVGLKTTTSFKKPGSTLVFVGKMHPGMAGSVFNDVHGVVGNDVPEPDLKVLPNTLVSLNNAARGKETKAVHDNSDGGVMTTLAEMCFGGDLGVDIDIKSDFNSTTFLFNQTSGMFIAEVDSPEDAERLFGEVPHAVIGKTTAEKKYTVSRDGQRLFSADVQEFKDAWQHTNLAGIFH